MSTNVIDQAVREELLTANSSYIVQAPAGSGKTELLTQRILALLAVVEKPENILAITFTRKAAAEMQSRVLSALQLAQKPEPEAAHEKNRWQLARKVLMRDQDKSWFLLENPARLNMTTIDSLSASLSSALPLLSQTGALPKIAENSTKYYREAADNLLMTITEGDQTAENIKLLLKHKDNNLAQVSELIAQMLAKRLQWLAPLNNHSRQFDQSQLMSSLRAIIEEKLQQIYEVIPNNIISELPALLNQANTVLVNNDAVNKPNIKALSNVEAIKPPCFEDLTLWKAIAELLLKSGKSEFLSGFTVRSGFPTEKDASDDNLKQQYKHNKKLVKDIAVELSLLEGVGELLTQVKLLPQNIETSISQQSLHAVVALLPMAVAHLKLIFSRYNVIDFSELSLASLEALGHPDMPTDLALALDYRIEHILIDEFQDTSTPQIELIKLLTANWEYENHRTLFLVGDPMQSIYRFRDANVGLFMQICQHGIGEIQLEFRQLKVNFRSSKTIVDWVNHHFSRIMPDRDDVAFAAVSYAESVAFNPPGRGSEVKSILTVDASEHVLQSTKILNIVQQHIEDNLELQQNKTLAVLARSRNHFFEIIQLLNQNNINFEAVEIDRLSEKTVVKDLTCLAFALCDQFDELNWSACMRAPWFGLQLEDIRLILTQTNITLPLPERISAAIELLSPAGQQRCKKILPLLMVAIEYKGRKPFRKWLYGSFTAVGGLAQLDFESDLDDLLVCLDKLTEMSEGGELNDRQSVYEAIDRLFAAPNTAADGQVQVMTIHKSKGLEFDTVILPRLDSGKRAADQVLLKWTEVLDREGNAHNLLAISKETGKKNDAIYQYISYLDSEKSKYEDQRVLYVAATRAKEKLYLLANIKSDLKSENGYRKPTGQSFLSMLWEGVKDDFKILGENNLQLSNLSESDNKLYQSRYIKQVKLANIANIPEQHLALPEKLPVADVNQDSSFIEVASVIGNVLHRQLQWLSENFDDSFKLPDNWIEITRSQLKQAYFFIDEKQLEQAVNRVFIGLKNILNDDFGRFVLTNHTEAASELVLHKKLEQGSFLTRVIDRTFVHQNIRWVIDYKSSQPEEGESKNSFVQREKDLYFSQVKDYFKLFEKLEKRPIIAGLYFPMITHFEKLLERK